MKAVLLRTLARRPLLYRGVLQLLGRGSLEKRIFLSLVREGDVVFDIGANRGHFTRLFSDLAGTGGAVHAFEPVPSTFAMLSAAVTGARGHRNVTLENCALGEAEGTFTFHLPGDDDGQASMRRHDSDSWAGAAVTSCECRVTTMDAYAREMLRLDFVKCDVEGAELPVVKGGAGTLERLSPMVFLESNGAWTKDFGYTREDLVSKMREVGYDAFFVADEKLTPLEDAGFSGPANLLCAKTKLHAGRLSALDSI